ncbi:MAG: CPBP family intramembrane glutamic endopeptidase [Anaerolineae bacterium]
MKRLAQSKTVVVLVTCLLYYACMAVGQWVMRYIGNTQYGTTGMLPWILPIELAMIILLLYVTRRFFVGDTIGLGQVQGKRRWIDLALTITPIALAGLLLLSWMTALSPQGLADIDKGILLTGIVGIGLVGISEEWMFRGLVLHHFGAVKEWEAGLSRASQALIARGLARQDWSSAGSKAIGITVNAILFSLLHAINVIGGYPPADVVNQLIGTLAFGVVFGVLAYWLPSIRPLMAWHFFWDYFTIVGSYVHTFR